MTGENANDRLCDICIVGAGLAGSLAAGALRKIGLDVLVIDARATPPPEFRAEKMGQDEMQSFARLGLEASLRKVVTNIDEIWVSRYGRRPIRLARREYGFAYSDLVAAVRDDAPEIGRVVAIETTPERQTVRLSDGRTISARLVVVSTGLGEAVRRIANVGVRVRSAAHSLSLGFDLARPAASYRFGSLVAYTERRADRSAYLTLFPIGSTMRGNLFVYRDAGDAWTREFRANPTASLAALVPALTAWTGPLAIASTVALRPLDLTEATDLQRPGLVLIGDAFMTCCPVPGVGIPKVLTDVECLVRNAARWFATPGMDVEKIATFYRDPEKLARDQRSMTASLHARNMAVSDGPAWAVRRLRNAVARHGIITARHAVSALGVGRGGAAA